MTTTTALYLTAGRYSTSPLPAPAGQSEVDADLVTPGLWGFATLFFFAVAVFLLGRSMARRVQRVDHRARLLLEEQERQGEAAALSSPATEGAEEFPREPADPPVQIAPPDGGLPSTPTQPEGGNAGTGSENVQGASADHRQ